MGADYCRKLDGGFAYVLLSLPDVLMCCFFSHVLSVTLLRVNFPTWPPWFFSIFEAPERWEKKGPPVLLGQPARTEPDCQADQKDTGAKGRNWSAVSNTFFFLASFGPMPSNGLPVLTWLWLNQKQWWWVVRLPTVLVAIGFYAHCTFFLWFIVPFRMMPRKSGLWRTTPVLDNVEPQPWQFTEWQRSF